MQEKIIGLVLAGGKSRRFGSQKAFAYFYDKRFWQISVEALQGITDRILIIGSSEVKSNFPKGFLSSFVNDLPTFQGKGPLAGLYSAMESEQGDWYFILPCDMPLVNQEIVKQIWAHRHPTYDVIIPKIFGQNHPLIGLYHPRIKGILLEMLQSQKYRMNTLLEKVNVKYLNEQYFSNLEVFTNVNDKETLEHILSLKKKERK